MTGPGFTYQPPSDDQPSNDVWRAGGPDMNPPSQPFDAFQPVTYHPVPVGEPAAPGTSGPPKRRAVLVLSIVAGLLFAAAGTFGTLWVVELKGHQAANEQLDAKNRELADIRNQLGTARSGQSDAESRLKDTQAKLAQAEQVKSGTNAENQCAAAGKRLAQAVQSNTSDADATKAGVDLILACR